MKAATVGFVGALAHRFPELRPILQEHIDDQNGEVLPHLLMADIERWVESEYLNRYEQAGELIRQVLAFMEEGLSDSDDDIAELIHASFLEHLPRKGEIGDGVREILGPKMKARLEQIG